MASVDDRAREAATSEVLAGGGEMGALMRAHDWAATPLGPVVAWPRSLITVVTLVLESYYPMMVMWGSDLLQVYNDAFRPILGATKHPAALGQRASDCWSEIWEVIAPLLARVRETGVAIWMDDLLLLLDRYGYLEETYFSFSYSPARDDSGQIGGILVTCTETTRRVLGERRLRSLRDLSARTAAARTVEDICTVAATSLSENEADLPFALLYLLDAAGTQARLVASTGLATPLEAVTWGAETGTLASMRQVDLAAPTASDALWPLTQVARTGKEMLVEAPGEFVGATLRPDIPRPHRALILPVVQAGQEHPSAVLVAGLSPRLALDDDYRGFFHLVAGQIGTAIANARAYEEECRRAEALAELDRAKTAFFSNVSHEFRTPLTLLLGPLEEVLAAPPETPLAAARTPLESARRNSLRLLRLVNTLLDFARIEAGRAEASFEPTDLATYTAELASAFRSTMERAGLRLLVDCPPLPQPVYVDREMWEKIVLNLLSNAVKFTFEGQITVTLRAEEETVMLTVRDTGVGIPAEELPRLFERFHRVRGARARTHEGTGIGLALVRELVALHGGTIAVRSVVEAGTTFTVTLPLGTAHLSPERLGAGRRLASTALGAAPYVEEALRWLPETPDAPDAALTVGAAAGTPPENAVAPPARVLLADDNADIRAYLRRLLGARYVVEAVSDGAAALAAARAHPPDLVLSDVMMPGLDGFELLRELRADPRTRTIPVLLLSARAGEEATAEGLEAGADDYLVKPFAASELLARVQAHLALARLRVEAMKSERGLRATAEEAHAALVAERDRLRTEVAARARAEEAVRQSNERLRLALVQLQTLQAVSEAAFAQLSQSALLRQVLERITAALAVDNVAILLLDETEQTLIVHHAVGPEEAQTGQMRVPVGRGVAGRIAATRQPLVLPDLRAVEPVNPLLREQMASLMGVPLMVEGRLLGVMHVDSTTSRQFTQDELHLLQLVADRVALALDSARLYEAERRARVEMEAERDRWQQVLDVLPVGVSIVDAQGRVEVLNQTGRAILGLDTRGQPLPAPGDEDQEGYRVYRPDGTPYPPTEVPLSRSLRQGEEVRGDQQLHRHAVTGHETPLLVNSAPLRAADGAIIGAVAIFHDMTELRALEWTREEFLSSAAHDLKTPLTGIRGHAQLAQRRLSRLNLPETAPVLEQLTRIRESSDVMVGLIDELVDVTRQQMGGALELHPALTNLVVLARDSVETQRAASGRAIHLEVEAPTLYATVDAARMARVLGNLLSNALKYSPPERPITVRLAREDGAGGPEAVLAVRDEGIGIPAADLPHIFDRFRRARNVVGHIQGTGIGLASARGIVAQHGGTIAAESTEGAGSTFTVRLPLEAP